MPVRGRRRGIGPGRCQTSEERLGGCSEVCGPGLSLSAERDSIPELVAVTGGIHPTAPGKRGQCHTEAAGAGGGALVQGLMYVYKTYTYILDFSLLSLAERKGRRRGPLGLGGTLPGQAQPQQHASLPLILLVNKVLFFLLKSGLYL